MTSLRDIVKNPLWWVFVLVMWVLALLGIYPHVPGLRVVVNVGPALDLTVLVIVMQVAERLTRPKQIVYQKKQHTTRKSVR